MGREAKAVKDRKCDHCTEVFQFTAKEIKDHALLCGKEKK